MEKQIKHAVDDEMYHIMKEYPSNHDLFKKSLVKYLVSTSQEKCQLHKFCEYDKMEPYREVEARLPMPFPLGTSADYTARNLKKKRGNIKVVVTEEALDDWQAQCLNVPYERLLAYLENQRQGRKNQQVGRESTIQDKQRSLIMKRQQQIINNFNLMKGSVFYWYHQDAKSVVIESEEHPLKRPDIDLSGSYDFRKIKKDIQDTQVLKKFSQQQRDLIRDIGGLPAKTLINIKKTRDRTKRNPNPFKLQEKSNISIHENKTIQQVESNINKSKLNQTTIDDRQYKTLKETLDTTRQSKRLQSAIQSHNRRRHNNSLTYNTTNETYQDNKKHPQDFWITDNAGYTVQSLHNMTLTMSEQNFYSTFTKRDATQNVQNIFEQSKKEAIEEYIINKAQYHTNYPPNLKQPLLNVKPQIQNKARSSVIINSQLRQEQKLDRSIVNELRVDDEIDQREPVVNLEVDKRKIKIDKLPVEMKPSAKVRNKRLDFNDPDFWFIKGYDHFKDFQLESAIDSYRQAIRIQRFQMASKWYSYAIQIEKDKYEAYLGLCLCQFKDGNASDALTSAEKGIQILKEKNIDHSYDETLGYLQYLQATCLKFLKRYGESEKIYFQLLKNFNREEGNKIAKYIFGMILMPIEVNRKKIMEYVEGFQGILEQYEAENVDRRKLIQFYLDPTDKSHKYLFDNEDPKWIDKHKPTVIKTLRQISFFQRFNIKRQREIMDTMKLKIYQKNQVLFFEAKEVYVIVSGSILMKNHERNVMLPQTYAKFMEGDILNFHQENSEIFNSVETWFFCQVDTEVAIFELEYFETIWKDLQQNDKLVLKNIISCHHMFNKLNDLTLMTLVFEMFEIRKYQKGEIIVTQSKQAPTNTVYRGYYDLRISKIAQDIKKRKKGVQDINSNKQSQMKTISTDQGDQLFKNQKSAAEYQKDQQLSPEKQQQEPEIAKKEIDEQTNEFEKEPEGIYIIDQGKCRIIHKQDQFESKILRRLDFFGECDLLKVIFVMKQYCQQREDISMLAYLFSNRYGVDIKEYANYY
ncbi:tpr domain containing protein [Stylonychia lemnae]|uniref:Tpr domain containing protein n=1 Tax=Stylonychia lemnae TaxID=5949 RepID=A0A078B3D8_STYLE|nr:tpr domain containing protein [Stylonychia lemnae]|eukprot:CDW89040.1 tpr domain containing protein [Stylonychia lemnae]